MASFGDQFGNFLTGFSRAFPVGAEITMRRQQLQMQQQMAEQQKELQKQQADRQELLTTLQTIKTGKEFEGKFGDLISLKGMMRLGIPEDEAKALQKEDQELFSNVYEPAIKNLVEENPNLGLSGAAQMIKQMTPAQRLDLMKNSAEKARAKADEAALQQIQRPAEAQPLGPAVNPQAPMAQALQINLQNLNAQLGALEQQSQLIVQSDQLSPAGKKAALAQNNTLADNTRARIGQIQTQLNQEIMQAQADRRLAQQDEINRRLEQRALDVERRHQENLRSTFERPLERPDREAIAAMEENVKIAKMLKTEFTDNELKKYVGVLQNPSRRVLQYFANDPKFARFQTLVNEVKGFAFAEGGKQLTGTEKQITWGHLPIGTEFSVADYISNLNRTLERTQDVIDRRIELATTPRKRVQQKSEPSGGAKPTPAADEERVRIISPSGVPGTIPASQLEDALKKGYKRG